MDNTSQNFSANSATAVIGVTFAGIALLAAVAGILYRKQNRKPQAPEDNAGDKQTVDNIHAFVPKKNENAIRLFGISPEHVEALREKNSLSSIGPGRIVSGKNLIPIPGEDEGDFEYVVSVDKLPNGSFRIKSSTRKVNS